MRDKGRLICFELRTTGHSTKRLLNTGFKTTVRTVFPPSCSHSALKSQGKAGMTAVERDFFDSKPELEMEEGDFLGQLTSGKVGAGPSSEKHTRINSFQHDLAPVR